MKYVYPAIFTPDAPGYRVRVPDLPGLITYGDSLADALYMAQDAASMWLWDAENKRDAIPGASAAAQPSADEPQAFVNYVAADTDAYRRQHDARAIKKTLTIPAWLNAQAEQRNAPFSQILQEGLKAYLGITQPTHPQPQS
ncbi:HicB family protein [Clostridia bacterium]|nr:HicB family protein [Clostridia bacterium]